MIGMSEIFLRDLYLNHHLGLFHLSEQRAERLARLEIYRSVLYLDNHVTVELTVKRQKFIHSLHGAVLGCRGIYKSAPHYNTAVWLQRIGNHIGSVCVCAAVILRT